MYGLNKVWRTGKNSKTSYGQRNANYINSTKKVKRDNNPEVLSEKGTFHQMRFCVRNGSGMRRRYRNAEEVNN